MTTGASRIIGWMAVAACVSCSLGGAALPTHSEGLRLYVAANGNDSWSGKLPKAGKRDGPFATLERARDEVRTLKRAGGLPTGGVIVVVGRGRYELARTFELMQEDAGGESAPVVYRAEKAGEVRLVGGKEVRGFHPVTDPRVLSRLDEGARGKVLQADLRAQGITDYGGVSGGGLELFCQDRPMTLARWPNEGFTHIVDVVGGQPYDIRGTKGDKVGKFTYEGDRPQRWVGEKDLWLHGYWFWDWSDQRQKVESIDTERRVISLLPPYHGYGYRKGQWYYVFNALSELDTPGEWYLDREAGLLYFYPPGPIQQGSPTVSVLAMLVAMRQVSHVALEGFVLEAARGTAVSIAGGAHVKVAGCTIRNVGGWAVRISGGEANGVVGCDIYETGDGGIALEGGDRKTLTPAGHYAENNHIHHYSRWHRMYQPAISLDGVGNRASHNLLDNAPHEAIAFGGNNHVIESNEIHSVCYESNDAGAIYSGRDWTMRGTVIRHNYLHDISGLGGRGCVGVYLDDMFCGTLIYGNVFYRVTNAAFIGGGRDNAIENNIFVECSPAVHVDARALGWAADSVDTTMKERLLAMPYQQPPWSTAYAKLVGILQDEPAAPKGNVIARNIQWGGRWADIEGRAQPYLTLQDNLLGEDPSFVDAQRLNFQLRDGSPAYKLGFQRIPMEDIGLYQDAQRASWPVEHKVRPTPTPPAQPTASKPAGPAPVFRARRAAAPVQLDGAIAPEEWGGALVSKAMVVEQGINGEKVQPGSIAWIAYDETCLLVAIDNEVDPSRPLQRGDQWGRDDAVEIALRNTKAGDQAPVLVLRGYPSGHFESSDEAGASPAAVARAAQGVEYRARVVSPSHWTAEWRVPFASLGIDPAKQAGFAFNLSVRKTSPQPFWLMWRGTGSYTWAVENAGVLELVR